MRIDPKQLEMGIKVEMEHTTDKAIARRIALDHLREIPDYYTRLLKMEREAGVVMGEKKEYKSSPIAHYRGWRVYEPHKGDIFAEYIRGKPFDISPTFTNLYNLKIWIDERMGLREKLIQMPEKEIREARQAIIPEGIIAKMSQGLELSEREKKIVRDHGKVYVPAFVKNGVVTVRPQLRNLAKKRFMPQYL